MHENHHGDDRKHQQSHPSEKGDGKESTRSGKRLDFAPWRPSQKENGTDSQHGQHAEKPFRSMEAEKQNVFGREPTNVGEKDEHRFIETLVIHAQIPASLLLLIVFSLGALIAFVPS